MIDVTKENFEQEVLNSNSPVLVDFWAEWCGPCRMMHPVLEQIEKELEGKLKICKVNVDQNPELSMQYEIMSIPNMKLFKDKIVVENFIGFRSKDEFIDEIKKKI